jgi:hypothetical protein
VLTRSLVLELFIKYAGLAGLRAAGRCRESHQDRLLTIGDAGTFISPVHLAEQTTQERPLQIRLDR